MEVHEVAVAFGESEMLKGNEYLVQDISQGTYGPEQIARFIHKLQETVATVDFQKNCVFIDEAGFHSQLMRGRAWSKVGTPANVKVHTQKGVNLRIDRERVSFRGIRRNPLKQGDELTPRIAEACNTVATKDCLQWVKHAESY
ncbi:hypothetical protein K501DRAFT_229053 [Backusella circina FSU 941]|nr:hypothetical protein K501DRAFT_229053 [Backusella circina FSU 941]